MNNITNCANCGAPLDFLSEENGIVKCQYCATQYHVNHDTINPTIEEYYVEFDFMGERRKFYIGDVEVNPIYTSVKRDMFGRLQKEKVASKIKMNLIEL